MGVTFIAPQGTYTAPAKLVTKEITENGTYDATDDSANGYSSVTVNVEGGGGETWETLFEGSVTTESEGNFASGDIVGLESLDGDSVKVTFNGAEYTLPKHELGYGEMGYGNVPDFTNYPLFIETTDTPCLLYTQTAGTYTLKIEEPQGGGSSDFSTAEVTINWDTSKIGNELSQDNCPMILKDDLDENAPLIQGNLYVTTSPVVVEVPLYNGKCYWGLPHRGIITMGNIEELYDGYLITGDGTITFSVGE